MLWAFLLNACFFSGSALAEATDTKYNIKVISAENTPSKQEIKLLKDFRKQLEERESTTPIENGNEAYGIKQDLALIQKMLEANGYYKPNVESSYDEESKTVTFTVDTGTQYKFGKIELIVEKGQSGKLKTPANDLLIATANKPALAQNVLDDQSTIDKWMENNNCLFEHKTRHEAILNNLQQKFDISYYVDAGAQATFGDIQFTGQKTIKDKYLKRLIKTKSGECFKRSKLNDMKVNLQKTGLLSKTEFKLPEAPNADGSVPITIAVSESKHRSVKLGANYGTDIGPGVSASWEHRNFLGSGEKLTSTLTASALEQVIDTKLTKPYFMRDDQRLKLSTSIGHKDNDAYQTTGFNVGGSVERDLDNKWTAEVGTKYGFEQIKDQTSTKNVALLSFPLFASQDKRNDILNPTKGWTVQFNTMPAVDTFDSGIMFLKNKIGGTYYQPFDDDGDNVLAARAAIGSILGASSGTVPATERFYSGGGGSIRGYGYQLVGPLDANLDPLGGRSFIELSTEMRMRITDDYGAVAFVDGGNTFDANYPDFSGDMLFGAGVGLRYYTDFGPLRMDLAVPLDKRDGVDDSYQLYFSIGQAF